MVMVHAFGASQLLDAFWVAFRIPNLLRDMIAEGALASAFTKVYSQLATQDPQRAQALLAHTLWSATWFALLVTALGMIFATPLAEMMTLLDANSTYSPDFSTQVASLTRLLFPYLALTSLGAVVMGALHQGGRFFYSSVAPMAFNASIVVGVLALGSVASSVLPSVFRAGIDDPTMLGLAVGVVLGGLLQLIFELSGLGWHRVSQLRSFLSWRPWHNPDLRQVITIMLPGAVAASAGPINQFVNTNFATSLEPGAVTWLTLSFRLVHLPIGLFGVAVGAAVLPALARSIVASTQADVGSRIADDLQSALEWVLWLLLPCFAIVHLSGPAIVSLVFEHGSFDAHATAMTAQALYAYALGMVPYGLLKVLTSLYYATERTRYAMTVSLIGIGTNFVANMALVQQLGHVGLAATTSLTLTVNVLLLLLGTRSLAIPWNLLRIRRNLLALGASWLFVLVVGRWVVSSAAFLSRSLDLSSRPSCVLELIACGCMMLSIFGLGLAYVWQINPARLLPELKRRLRRAR